MQPYQRSGQDIGRQRVVFLDRDGTIIVEKNYLSNPSQVELESAAIAGLKKINEAGFRIVGVTNQSGVGRGYFDMSAVNAVNAHVDTLLACHDLFIEGWFVCPHAPDMNCDCRKPKPGLLYQAQAKLGLDLKDCWVIGDKPTDVMLARAVGGRGILVGTGHSGDGANWALANGHDFAVDLNEAAEIIVRSTKRADRIGLL